MRDDRPAFDARARCDAAASLRYVFQPPAPAGQADASRDLDGPGDDLGDRDGPGDDLGDLGDLDGLGGLGGFGGDRVVATHLPKS